MQHVSINYLAVFVSAIISFVIGFLWYGLIFKNAWLNAVGKTEEELRKNNNVKFNYFITFVSEFFMALVVAYFIALTGATNFVGALRVALAAWVGFVATVTLIDGLFAKRRFKLLLINSVFHLVNLIIFAAVLINWR